MMLYDYNEVLLNDVRILDEMTLYIKLEYCTSSDQT